MKNAGVPREFSENEKLILRWLLPEDRSGYDAYYRDIMHCSILGYGRWGEGDYIVGTGGAAPDSSLPMARVWAFGVLASGSGSCSVTVHEKLDSEFEIQFSCSGGAGKEILANYSKRYCYSYWKPGYKAPLSESNVREIPLEPGSGLTLAVAPGDQRIWLHDQSAGVNHLIPHMQFHNELMRVSGLRDKDSVFNPKLLFVKTDGFNDDALRSAFRNYNMRRRIAAIDEQLPARAGSRQGILARLFNRNRK